MKLFRAVPGSLPNPSSAQYAAGQRIYNAANAKFSYALTVGPGAAWRELDLSTGETIDILVLVALDDREHVVRGRGGPDESRIARGA